MKKINQKLKIILPGIAIFVASIYAGVALSNKEANADTNKIIVYKSPTCGCCNKWISHLEKAGFNVSSKNMRDMKSVKDEIGVQRQFQSCHTAKVGNYFIEGHVPAADIKKLLSEKPDIKGLAVPGMPMGSPGMEGHRADHYDVIAVGTSNDASVYSSY